jgi:hypothetical protein
MLIKLHPTLKINIHAAASKFETTLMKNIPGFAAGVKRINPAQCRLWERAVVVKEGMEFCDAKRPGETAMTRPETAGETLNLFRE